jgi:hypothetical protein
LSEWSLFLLITRTRRRQTAVTPLLAARPPALASASHGCLAGAQRDRGPHEPATDDKTVCALDVEKSKRGATAASATRSETPPITNKNSRCHRHAAGRLNIFVQCYQIRTNFVASQTRLRVRVLARLHRSTRSRTPVNVGEGLSSIHLCMRAETRKHICRNTDVAGHPLPGTPPSLPFPTPPTL